MGDSPAHGKRYLAVRMKSFVRASRRHAMRPGFAFQRRSADPDQK
ncbi:hypothetical protein [Cupriavidus sp. UYPR2.512]|nr:hypothetical protein [Cupriavidus sp. UYPR2.512]